MAEYRPTAPFNVPMLVYKPTYTTSYGVNVKTYPENGFLIYGTFKTYGGSETTVNGVYSIIDTADVDTWYRPDITSDCMIELAGTGAKYQILGEPENINRQNRYLKLKLQRVKGGA